MSTFNCRRSTCCSINIIDRNHYKTEYASSHAVNFSRTEVETEIKIMSFCLNETETKAEIILKAETK